MPNEDLPNEDSQDLDEEGSRGTPLTELISIIAQALVDDPASVDVQEIDEGDGALIELRVAPADIGKVIGKEGRTAQSMRAILMAASSKMGRRAHLDIVD